MLSQRFLYQSNYTKLKTKKHLPKMLNSTTPTKNMHTPCGLWFGVFWRHPTYTSNVKHTIYGLRMKMLLSHWKSSTTPSSYGTVVCTVRPLLRMFAIHYPRMIIYTAVLFVWFVVFLRVFFVIFICYRLHFKYVEFVNPLMRAGEIFVHC